MRQLRSTQLGVVALLAALALAFVASAAPARGFKECGDLVPEGAGVYDVQAKNTDCKRARKTARSWQKSCTKSPCTVNGFTCRYRPAGEELVKARCVHGKRVIRFEFGS